ncbi:MAG TPA: O-antigen ligase family protein [Solirubrobacterales bacterium]|nr:O-antigen ligase family protein [Solirubrobacterales bacterium]
MSGFLAGAGVLAAAAASGAAILLPPGRLRSAAMLVALLLFPVLILGDQWHTHQIVDLRHSNGRIVALLAAAAVIVAALAYLFRRWPILLPLAIVAALPFRIPLHAGGDTANLLVPLYLVIGGGVLAVLVRDWTAPPPGGRGGDAANGASLPRPQSSPSLAGPGGRAALWLPRLLAAFVVLYAVQTLYSEDFSKGLQNVCFFLVPFTVAFALLQGVKWDEKLLRLILIVVATEAVAFVLVGSVEYLTRSLFWNDAVIRSNEFHTYFRVNSVFWDPNIYGRYLALVLVVVTTALLWAKDRRNFWLLAATILVLWIGLAQTFSQSSLIALLAGLAVLAAIRWSGRWTLAAVAVGVVGAVLVVTLVGGKSLDLSSIVKRLNVDTSGRANLVSGGAELFEERPLWGYGSGSFQKAYANHRENKKVPVSVSHTEPVTVAAEQGLIGLALYIALIVVALWAMTAGLRGRRAGRAAVLAAFVALLVHTMAYAGFFEDPITWVLLAVGAALASTPFAPSAVRDPA